MFDKSIINKAYNGRKLTPGDRHRHNYVDYFLSVIM